MRPSLLFCLTCFATLAEVCSENFPRQAGLTRLRQRVTCALGLTRKFATRNTSLPVLTAPKNKRNHQRTTRDKFPFLERVSCTTTTPAQQPQTCRKNCNTTPIATNATWITSTTPCSLAGWGVYMSWSKTTFRETRQGSVFPRLGLCEGGILPGFCIEEIFKLNHDAENSTIPANMLCSMIYWRLCAFTKLWNGGSTVINIENRT